MTTQQSTPPTVAVDASMFREYDIRGYVDQNFTEPALELYRELFEPSDRRVDGQPLPGQEA